MESFKIDLYNEPELILSTEFSIKVAAEIIHHILLNILSVVSTNSFVTFLWKSKFDVPAV